MAKLKLNAIEDDKPVKATVEFPAVVWRDLQAYAEILGREHQQAPVEPAKLVPVMVTRFMATDRGFARLRRTRTAASRSNGDRGPEKIP
ncbi:DUF2274 domain-containing protein [Bradyrhizobium cenepequi]